MTYLNESPCLIATTSVDSDRVPSFIHADELTQSCRDGSFRPANLLTCGDIIKHFTGDVWLVISEPEYTNTGITFDVMWLDIDSRESGGRNYSKRHLSSDNTQSVCFSPHWRFELVTHQSPVKAQTVAA